MALEIKIEELTKSIEKLIATLGGIDKPKNELKKKDPSVSKPIISPTEPEIIDHVVIEHEVTKPIVTSSSPLPNFLQDIPTEAELPFNDAISLGKYVIDLFEADTEKGPKIGNILTSLGCKAISDVRPDQYTVLYEELRKI